MSRAFQKMCPMSSTHWGYNPSWTGRRARGSSMFCAWREEMSGYYALVWSLLTWLAHGMLEAAFDFSTIWTVELSSLSRIFDAWYFHQLHSTILCGFHHLVCAQMKNEELWIGDAIKHEMVELILWNLMVKHQRRLRMGSHCTQPTIPWTDVYHISWLRNNILLSMPFGLDWS